MFEPNSILRLMGVRFDSELRNTLWFPNKETQESYFLSQPDYINFDNITYVKKDQAIVLPCREEDIWRFNYVMYRNTNFSNKWFFAFVVKREWASDYSTKLYLKTDPIQTWMFNWSLMTSFIERQHSITDTPGDNEVPETFSASVSKFNGVGNVDLKPNIANIYATTDPTGTISSNASVENGILSGSGRMLGLNIDTQLDTIKDQLNTYVDNGVAYAVSKIQQIPGNAQTPTSYSFSKYPSTVSGYTPKNKKLLSGLFNKDVVSMYGQRMVIDPRLVRGNDFRFIISSDWSSGTVFAFADNAGASGAGEISINAVIPESTWSYNQFRNDVNLHSQSNGIELARAYSTRNYQAELNKLRTDLTPWQTIAGGIGDAFSLNFGGMASDLLSMPEKAAELNYEHSLLDNGIDSITQQLAKYSEDLHAPATGNISSSNGFIASGATYLQYGYLSPPENIAKVYDDFLTVYGYAQNTYAIPNLHARESWTYVKVTELMMDGNCPDEDELAIKNAFKNGIFFWSYNKEYGNFNQSNNIV